MQKLSSITKKADSEDVVLDYLRNEDPLAALHALAEFALASDKELKYIRDLEKAFKNNRNVMPLDTGDDYYDLWDKYLKAAEKNGFDTRGIDHKDYVITQLMRHYDKIR